MADCPTGRTGRRTDAEMEALSLRSRLIPRLEVPIRGIEWHENRRVAVTLDEPVTLEDGCAVSLGFVNAKGRRIWRGNGFVAQVSGPSVLVWLSHNWSSEAIGQATYLIRPNQHVIGVGV